MKRSHSLRLTLMAVAIPAALTGCMEEPDSGVVLLSETDCRSTPNLRVDVATCENAYRTALADHQRVAPRFEDRSECDEQFGTCTALAENGSSFYIPPMGGFLLGYYASKYRDKDDHDAWRYTYSGSSPLYRDRFGDYTHPGGGYVSNTYGTFKGYSGTTTAPARAITVSRAGFGSSSAARASFGGGRGGFGG